LGTSDDLELDGHAVPRHQHSSRSVLTREFRYIVVAIKYGYFKPEELEAQRTTAWTPQDSAIRIIGVSWVQVSRCAWEGWGGFVVPNGAPCSHPLP
jgi:hypothetical protein